MKSNAATLFLLFALSVIVIQVRCNDDNPVKVFRVSRNINEDDDTSVVNAVDSGENTYIPDYGHKNALQCGATEEYSNCDANPSCQRTCDNLNLPGIPCAKRSCIEGCICKSGFVRSELYGGCIPVDQCGRVKH